MIELDEKDVKQVARGRFFRKWRKHLIGITLGLFGGAITIVVIPTDPGSDSWIVPTLIAILVGLFIGLVLYARGEVKAEKALVKEWKQDQA